MQRAESEYNVMVNRVLDAYKVIGEKSQEICKLQDQVNSLMAENLDLARQMKQIKEASGLC